jgi:hypothetical protein
MGVLIPTAPTIQDTATGLEWLDVAVSANITYQTIQSQFSQAGLFSGFRYATDLELSGNDQSGHNPGQVHTLFESAGLGEGFSFSVVGYGLVSCEDPSRIDQPELSPRAHQIPSG